MNTMHEPSKFEVRIPGINPDNLTELQGENGLFYVTRIGGKPEMEHGFFYGDEKHQFCFYAHYQPAQGSKVDYDVEVHHITTGRLEGPFLRKIPRLEADYIENNIRKFFKTCSFFLRKSRITTAEHPREIHFTWRIAQ
jgi:hypothetical protein